MILVGGVDTALLIQNTLNTLKSYESISRNQDKSIILKYLENESSSKEEATNDNARFLISGLCMLFSGENSRLDDKDLEHWINFEKVTSYPAQLASLETVSNLKEITSGGNVISVASIAPVKGNTDLDDIVEVQYIGYVPEGTPEASVNRLPVHFVTTDGLFEELTDKLKESIQELKAKSSARVQRSSILDDNDEALDNGLVL